jgi:hypothetical protein
MAPPSKAATTCLPSTSANRTVSRYTLSAPGNSSASSQVSLAEVLSPIQSPGAANQCEKCADRHHECDRVVDLRSGRDLARHRLPRLSALPTTLPMHHARTGLPSWRGWPARIAASRSIIAGLKFCVVARNSCIATSSARSRCNICADCQGSYPALTTLNRLHSCRTSLLISSQSDSLPGVTTRRPAVAEPGYDRFRVQPPRPPLDSIGNTASVLMPVSASLLGNTPCSPPSQGRCWFGAMLKGHRLRDAVRQLSTPSQSR